MAKKRVRRAKGDAKPPELMAGPTVGLLLPPTLTLLSVFTLNAPALMLMGASKVLVVLVRTVVPVPA